MTIAAASAGFGARGSGIEMITARSSISAPPAPNSESRSPSPELRKAFHDFVGQSFFSQLLSQMRKTVDKPAYFHGGMGEDLFQARMDEVLVEHLSDAAGETFSEPMFDLFMMPRS